MSLKKNKGDGNEVSSNTKSSPNPELKINAAWKKIDKKIAETLNLYFGRVRENMGRVRTLVGIHFSLKRDAKFSTRPGIEDILRLAVVFTHATLEDFLRTIAINLLPEADEQELNKIPLSGLGTFGRAEKFNLGTLAKFKGARVDDVIKNSVKDCFEHSNFNNVNDIDKLLKSLGIEVSKIKQSFPKLAELMERRHLIVHRADKKDSLDDDKKNLQEISADEVLSWLEAVRQFISDVMKTKFYVGGIVKALTDEGIIKKSYDRMIVIDED